MSLKAALFEDERYVRPSRIAILVMMFQCFTGYYAIIAYSEVLLEDNFGEDQKITARTGTYLVALTNMLGSIASIYFIHSVGRRTILLIG